MKQKKIKNRQEFLPVFRPDYGDDEIKAVSEVLRSGWIGLGPKTLEFENSFASHVESRFAIALNSATAALHLALIVAGVKPGDEVIVPSLTFVSDVHAILYVGAIPIFVDIEPDTLCLSVADVTKKISRRTKAIIAVDYGGHPCEYKELEKITSSRNIIIIEDAAHACGSSYEGRPIGSINPLTCFSFHAVKNLATGDGGMVTTNNEDFDKHLRHLRWMGINTDTWNRLKTVSQYGSKSYKGYGWYYEITELGYKCHMNDITAALGLAQLKKLATSNDKRQKLAAIYTKELSKLPEVECPIMHPNVVSAQHNYVIRSDARDELHLFLREKYISTGVHYFPVHLQPYYRKLYPKTHLPETESLWPKLLTLPLYPQMNFTDQNRVINSICEFFHTGNEKINTGPQDGR